MYAYLLPPHYKETIKQWIHDDCPTIDIGGYVVGDKIESATLYLKSSGVLAGVPFASAVFEYLNLEVHWLFEEGSYIDVTSETSKKVIVAVIKGPCRNILLSERTALNILSRACGVATQASLAQRIADQFQWKGYISGTRKTTPGFRFVEKYALLVGGIATHRQDLSQMVMLKDNHIWSCGSITNAVKKAKTAAGFSCKIEVWWLKVYLVFQIWIDFRLQVECQSIEEALEAASAGAEIVMLDNFTADTIQSAAKEIKISFPQVLIEASGVSLIIYLYKFHLIVCL